MSFIILNNIVLINKSFCLSFRKNTYYDINEDR